MITPLFMLPFWWYHRAKLLFTRERGVIIRPYRFQRSFEKKITCEAALKFEREKYLKLTLLKYPDKS